MTQAPVEHLKLHELTDAALDLERLMDQLVDSPEEEREAGLREALSLLDADIMERGEYLAALVVNRIADAKVLYDKAQAFQKRADALGKRGDAIGYGAQRLKDYIAGCLSARGDDKQVLGGKTADVTITVSKQSPAKPKIIEADRLPPEHLTAHIEWPADSVPTNMLSAIASFTPRENLLANLKDVEELPAGVEMRLPTRAVRVR